LVRLFFALKKKSLVHSSPFTAHELGVQAASGIIPILHHFERLMT
jgi:hypothetical protein